MIRFLWMRRLVCALKGHVGRDEGFAVCLRCGMEFAP